MASFRLRRWVGEVVSNSVSGNSRRCAVEVVCIVATCLVTAMGCTPLDAGSDDYCRLSPGADPCIEEVPDSGNVVVDPEWSCVGEIPDHGLPELPAVAYVVPIVDFANPLIAPQVDIEICIITDLNCTTPVTDGLVAAGLPPISQPDPMRPYLHQITLPYEFEGYLQLTATGYLTTNYYFGGPMIGDPRNPAMPQLVVGETLPMPRVTSIDEFFSLLSSEPRDTSTGLLALRVLNCERERSARVRLNLLTTDSGAAGWTLINNQPATDTDPIETDSRGVSGFANIRAPITALVEGTLPDGRRYGGNGWAVRPNQLTVGEVRTDYTYGR